MKKISYSILVLALVSGIVYFASGLNARRTAVESPAAAEHSSVVGDDVPTAQNPLLVVKVPKGVANERLCHSAYVSYFNKQHRIPNCVIYELSATEVSMCDAPGAEKRKDYNFLADPMCLASPEPDEYEYKHYGYDRGHMAPANDMKWSKTSMMECFYMTNMCPQLHALNDGAWKHLELAVHRWAKRDKRLIIASGPVLKNNMRRIGKHRDISVPGAFYKVIYAPNQGRAIGFIFNNEKVSGSYTKHAVSVDYVERMTGLDFFSAVDDKVENQMEAKADIQQWTDKDTDKSKGKNKSKGKY